MQPEGYSFARLTRYFLKLGTFGFGGPIALVGYMERDLVEAKKWMTRDEYVRGLALAQLAPGPLAAQLAMYIGYIRNGYLGATLIGAAFILPSFVMVVMLGMLYVAYGGLEWMQAVFYGISAAVVGIIIKSSYKLIKVTLKNKVLLWGIFGVLCAVTAFTGEEIIWLIVLSGVIALFALAPPVATIRKAYSLTIPLGTAAFQIPSLLSGSRSAEIFLFFAKAGTIVFGSGLAIVPFLHGSVVQQYHWLTERQFLDSVAVAMITPGPVVITVGFIGYLVGNIGGAVAAAMGVFLPVWLVVLFITPIYEKLGRNPQVQAFVQGVTSAATGAIAGAVIVLGRRAIVDIPTALIAIVSLVALFRLKIPEPVIIAAAGVAGLVLTGLK